MSRESLQRIFPQLFHRGFQITSPATTDYNCVAWGLGRFTEWWGSDPFMAQEGLYRWGDDVPHIDTLETWTAVFLTEGFQLASDSNLEPGYEKVALFATEDNAPAHVARQLPSGRWTSKLGKLEDIEHELTALEGESYGTVARVLKRPAKQSGRNELPRHP